MTASDVPTAPDGASPGRSWLIPLALLVVAILALGLWLAWSPQQGQVQGIVDAREFRVASKVTGRLSAVLVAEGATVKAGQLLGRIDSPEVAAKEAQANATIDAAQSQADKARAGARQTEITAAEAQWRRAAAAADLAQVPMNESTGWPTKGPLPARSAMRRAPT